MNERLLRRTATLLVFFINLWIRLNWKGHSLTGHDIRALRDRLEPVEHLL